jgi:hypothetical protein
MLGSYSCEVLGRPVNFEVNPAYEKQPAPSGLACLYIPGTACTGGTLHQKNGGNRYEFTLGDHLWPQ